MTTIGQYEVVRRIGEGGFARTYEARHVVLGKKACLKQNLNVTPDDVAIMKEEARLLWDLNHHSLPAVKDFIECGDGSYVLAMTFVDGKNLEEIVRKHKAIHPEDVCWIGQRLLNALHYLHANGVVHSDVKPQNVIVQPKVHNAVLVDYGLSVRRPDRSTRPKGFTEAFAAPELLASKPPIPESDLYGFGITMLYALGGDFTAKRFPPKVPAPVQDYFAQFLRYDPVERPNWEDDLVRRLSDVRLEAFGRRHSGGVKNV